MIHIIYNPHVSLKTYFGLFHEEVGFKVIGHDLVIGNRRRTCATTAPCNVKHLTETKYFCITRREADEKADTQDSI